MQKTTNCKTVVAKHPGGKLKGAIVEARTAISTNFSRPHLFLANVIEVYAEDIAIHALVDTGAAISVISNVLRLKL